MDFEDFRDIFEEVMPIIVKASPVIASLIGTPATTIIVGLLGALVETSPCDHCKLAHDLKEDPDIYAKLTTLEATHADWLKSLQEHQNK